MPDTPETTRPRPFVFVLMPFDKAFDDVYKLGIKGAAEQAGAYAERVDEQIFTEGILDRVFNQINKADVIVADMTGRNPNVFYEVGYAHALGRTVLLLTKKVEDIPFDLQHRPHIVYGDSITKLKDELAARIEWAIRAGRDGNRRVIDEPLVVSIESVQVPRQPSDKTLPDFAFKVDKLRGYAKLAIHVINPAFRPSEAIQCVYLMTTAECSIQTVGTESRGPAYSPITPPGSLIEDKLSHIFHIPTSIPSLPPRGARAFSVYLQVKDTYGLEGPQRMRVRLQTAVENYDFDFSGFLA